METYAKSNSSFINTGTYPLLNNEITTTDKITELEKSQFCPC